MSLEITFSDDTFDILLSITNLIENKWGLNQANKFLAKVYKTLDSVAQNPYMFKASSINEEVESD